MRNIKFRTCNAGQTPSLTCVHSWPHLYLKRDSNPEALCSRSCVHFFLRFWVWNPGPYECFYTELYPKPWAPVSFYSSLTYAASRKRKFPWRNEFTLETLSSLSAHLQLIQTCSAPHPSSPWPQQGHLLSSLMKTCLFPSMVSWVH